VDSQECSDLVDITERERDPIAKAKYSGRISETLNIPTRLQGSQSC
jgi:hypothetical protein